MKKKEKENRNRYRTDLSWFFESKKQEQREEEKVKHDSFLMMINIMAISTTLNIWPKIVVSIKFTYSQTGKWRKNINQFKRKIQIQWTKFFLFDKINK